MKIAQKWKLSIENLKAKNRLSNSNIMEKVSKFLQFFIIYCQISARYWKFLRGSSHWVLLSDVCINKRKHKILSSPNFLIFEIPTERGLIHSQAPKKRVEFLIWIFDLNFPVACKLANNGIFNTGPLTKLHCFNILNLMFSILNFSLFSTESKLVITLYFLRFNFYEFNFYMNFYSFFTILLLSLDSFS